MSTQRSLSALELLTVADRTLQAGGYRAIEGTSWDRWSNSARAYEDLFGVVAVFVFVSSEGLVRDWASAQSDLVDLITTHIGRDDAKAWDGYLVLLTGAPEDPGNRPEINEIRRDTGRVRKIVATGGELDSLQSIERVLLPLLPLGPELPPDLPQTALEVLPELLEHRGIPPAASRGLLDAFDRQSSLMRALQESVER